MWRCALTKNVLVVDVVLHFEAGPFHCEIDVDFFNFHVRHAVPLHRFAVHFGNGTDIGCTEYARNTFLVQQQIVSNVRHNDAS